MADMLGATKAERLKNLKKLYNQHRINYKQYMLEVKKVEKYWVDPIEKPEDVEMPVNPEEGGFVAPEVVIPEGEPEVELPENPELPVNPEL